MCYVVQLIGFRSERKDIIISKGNRGHVERTTRDETIATVTNQHKLTFHIASTTGRRQDDKEYDRQSSKDNKSDKRKANVWNKGIDHVWYGRSYCMLCVEASVLISVDVEND
jgi:hypothetical protein